MGDEQVAALEVLQELFEELDALEVEMVGRLVEQQQIDFRQQNAGEHGPVLLAAAELRDRPLPLLLVREPDAGQHPLDFGVQGVAVGVLVVVLQLRVLFEQAIVVRPLLLGVGEVVLDGPHLPLDGQHVSERRLHEVEERHPRLGVEMLADVADGEGVGADRVTVEHLGWDAIPQNHAARHGFPLATFQLRFAEWWQVLMGDLAEVAAEVRR